MTRIACLLMGCVFSLGVFAQGRVVINEYLPWTSNGCGATAEFVELMNYGPGPINIGCYILTDGDFAVTIPPNTILYPGQFYVLAGQDIISSSCANIDSTIHANLNWNTCGCSSGAIPTTGDGFFTDGGSANEQVVLMDPNLNVVDAVVRSFPVEPSSTVTTPSISGCASHSFNLDSMSFMYETLGMSTGRGNSFARKLDGDCGWVKDPQQSGHATNNTPGVTSDVSYDFSLVTGYDCDAGHGIVSIFVRHLDLSTIFPISYTIANDVNDNNIFEFTDLYTYGKDSTPPNVTIDNLVAGHYRITVSSVLGCDLATFEFRILPCYSTLPVKLIYFNYAGLKKEGFTFNWLLNEVEQLESVTLERARPFSAFEALEVFNQPPGATGSRYLTATAPATNDYYFYRLKIRQKNGSFFYSPVLDARQPNSFSQVKLWPNPATDLLHLSLPGTLNEVVSYRVFDSKGSEVKSGSWNLTPGVTTATIPLTGLAPGLYHLQTIGHQPISLRFVKH
jgi:hypothetical protein